MHVLVTSRPPDASLPSVPPTSLPEDDSGAYLAPEGLPGTEAEVPTQRRAPALYTKVRPRLIGDRILEMSFVLHAKAHVKLVAKRAGRVVAATRRYTMGPGRRSLKLRLDPDRWPTKVDLQVEAVKGRTG
jgi:hypothetical protein